LMLSLCVLPFSLFGSMVVLALGHFAVLLATYLASTLNGQKFYEDSVREEAARAISGY